MPPRLRKRAKVTYTEEDDVKPEAVKAESSKAVKAEASKDKKTKAGGTVARRGDRHIRGKRGGLESMPNMPLDVLIEVRVCSRILAVLRRLTHRVLHLADFWVSSSTRPSEPGAYDASIQRFPHES